MSAALPLAARPDLRVEYLEAALADVLADPEVMAVFGFGQHAPASDDPRYLRIALEPHGAAPLEVWRTPRPVRCERDGDVRVSEDGALQFGVIELSEPGTEADDATDILATAEAAYRRLVQTTARRGYPHLLRVWNYLDGITAGEGDAERYRTFCVGRARGLAFDDPGALPAATAIGRVDGARTLQVYWLAAREPGLPLENPRQLSAYRYPRQYGPQPPSFARAMLPPGHMPLLVSGTAAIVGHASQHADCATTQVDETLANIDALLAAAHARQLALPLQMGADTCLKVYVRDTADLPVVAAHLDARLGPGVPRLVLHAAICRRELRVEIDGVHG